MPRTRLLFALILAWTAAALPAPAAPPQHLRLVVSPAARTWSLQERVGTAYRTLLRDARVRVVRADGSEVAWSSMRLAPDGHSFTLEGPDMSLKVLAQWLDPQRLPATLALLPIAYARQDGVQLREVSVAQGALLPTITPDAVVYAEGFQSRSASMARPLPADAPVTSWWVTGLHSRRQSCVAGYLSNVLGANSFRVARLSGGVTISDRTDLRRMGVPRVVGGTPLDALYLSWGHSPTNMLAEYAAGARVFTGILDPNPAFTPQAIPAGWSAGRAPSGEGIPDRVNRNADALKRLFGTADARFIHLRVETPDAATARDIRARGYRAGLRLTPFAVEQGSPVQQEHPDWLLKDREGVLVTHRPDGEAGEAVFVLDPSVQPARAWLRDQARMAAREWGYDLIELDHLHLPLLEEGVMTGDMTPVQAYRAALRAMRLGAGPDAYLLGDGAPIGPTIGLVNGNRIGPESHGAWADIVEAARGVAGRQWMHNVWWQNDPGPVTLGASPTLDQARAWTAAVALSGGLTLFGGDLTGLPDDRAALARMALPVTANGGRAPFGARIGQAVRATGMRPADLWTPAPIPTAGEGGEPGPPDPPSIWLLPNSVSPARITVAALFNWGDAVKATSVTPASLGAAPKGKRAHVWDVWEARYLGATTGSLPLEIPATASRLLAIAPDVGHPQLLGTDANITAGAGAIPGVRWDAKYRVLRGRSRTAPGAAFRIAFTVPKGLGLFRLDAPGATVERLPSEPGSALFRITPERPEVVWTARYAKG